MELQSVQGDECDGYCQDCDWVNLDNYDSVNEKLKELEPTLYDSFSVQRFILNQFVIYNYNNKYVTATPRVSTINAYDKMMDCSWSAFLPLTIRGFSYSVIGLIKLIRLMQWTVAVIFCMISYWSFCPLQHLDQINCNYCSILNI